MGDTATLPRNQGKMLTYDAAVILEAIAADLRRRVMTVRGENGPATVALPLEAKLELGFKGKAKPGKRKHKLAIEITWKEKDEARDGEVPDPGEAPCQGCQSDAAEAADA